MDVHLRKCYCPAKGEYPMAELIANVNRDYAEILNGMDAAELFADVEAFNTRLKDARAKAWDTPLPTYIMPYFLSLEDIAYFRKASNILLECQEKLIKIYYDHPEHRELYELTGAEDWPPVTDTSDSAWRDSIRDLRERHESFMKAVRAFPESKLSENAPNRDHSYYVLLQGMVQHDLYHAGQIAILKKAAR